MGPVQGDPDILRLLLSSPLPALCLTSLVLLATLPTSRTVPVCRRASQPLWSPTRLKSPLPSAAHCIRLRRMRSLNTNGRLGFAASLPLFE